jgi:hypothetical protein
MGIERDYLMRQLMMFFEVIQKIARLRRKGEKEEAEKEISIFYSSLEIDKKAVELNIKEFVEYLVSGKKLTNEHLEMIAFVMKEQGELAANEEKMTDYFRKAYFILDKVERESLTFSMDRQMRLAELRSFLSDS